MNDTNKKTEFTKWKKQYTRAEIREITLNRFKQRHKNYSEERNINNEYM